MQTTHKWATNAYEYFMTKYEKTKWVLFPIIQWWLHKDLREESINYLSKLAFDWIAIWWLSVGESQESFNEIVDFIWDKLPTDITRYLMWIWTPKYIKKAIKSWIDMFDCVLPTRLGRHWWAFVNDEIIKLKNARFKEDFSPVDSTCNCYCCKNFSKAYIHHLIKEKEMLWWILLSLHNIVYLNNLVNRLREEILSS
jgi:queuine tRNA-ribosyltransferase